jgi:phosphatidylserine/phosphatidylglycerophosphate/cardiolipin synthase-like enzyme
MRKLKQWSLALVLAGLLAQWAWTLVPTTGQARARDVPAPPTGVANGADASLGSAQVLGVFFTPPSGAGHALVRWIDAAQTEVLVQAYGFTHNAIAQALLRAHQRGVRVAVLLDQKSSASNQYVMDLLRNAQVPMRLDGKHAIAHNKVMVIDQHIVVTGSFNFTNSADTRNAENLLVLSSQSLASRYHDNWESHWAHAATPP